MNAHSETTLTRSLGIQLRVIHALLLREVITRYGRNGLGVIWIIIEPMLFTLGVAGVWYLGNLHTLSNIPIVAFAITGYSSILLWRNVANRCSKAIEPNLSLMYHRNVKVIDVYLSRVVLEWTGATASFAALTVIFSAAGVMQWPNESMPIIHAWFLLMWFSLALGLIIGAMSEISETVERVWHVAQYLLFPFSGAAYMVDWLPTSAQEAILWIPMVHGVELLRHGFFGEIVRTHETPGYLFVVSLVMSMIGLFLVAYISRKVQPE